jgi:hypothetical protein
MFLIEKTLIYLIIIISYIKRLRELIKKEMETVFSFGKTSYHLKKKSLGEYYETNISAVLFLKKDVWVMEAGFFLKKASRF